MVIHSSSRENLFLKDDYVRDNEGIIYLVILNGHPAESVIVVPKYVPRTEGKWRGSYTRLFQHYTSKELHHTAKSVIFRKYEFYSRHFGKRLLSIPKNLIAEHYIPEIKLKNLMFTPRNCHDSLQRKAIILVNMLVEMGIEQSSIGITGSLLYDLHMPFSNLNIILYGIRAVNVYLTRIEPFVEEYRNVNIKAQFLDIGGKHLDLGLRVRTFLWVDDVSVAIHVNEFPDFHFSYGSELTYSLGTCKIVGKISNVGKGFIQKRYALKPIEVIMWPDIREIPPETLQLRVFSGRSEDIIFEEDELVSICGVLQRIEQVEGGQKKPSFQISVGLEELPGYVCPLSIFSNDP